MLRRLQQAMVTGEYLMLYMDPGDTGKFCYGRVLAADEDFAALYLIAPDGAYDGLLVKETGSVQRIESGGQYDAKMRKLMQGIQLPDRRWEAGCGRIAAQLLSMAARHGWVASVEFRDSGTNAAVGLVTAVNGETAELTLIDEYGYGDGACLFRMDSVTQVACDGGEERAIRRLWQANSGQ